ncbi:uncharacterized protein LOC102806464 [Saccoglossus kowalevskii]
MINKSIKSRTVHQPEIQPKSAYLCCTEQYNINFSVQRRVHGRPNNGVSNSTGRRGMENITDNWIIVYILYRTRRPEGCHLDRCFPICYHNDFGDSGTYPVLR